MKNCPTKSLGYTLRASRPFYPHSWLAYFSRFILNKGQDNKQSSLFIQWPVPDPTFDTGVPSMHGPPFWPSSSDFRKRQRCEIDGNAQTWRGLAAKAVTVSAGQGRACPTEAAARAVGGTQRVRRGFPEKQSQWDGRMGG